MKIGPDLQKPVSNWKTSIFSILDVIIVFTLRIKTEKPGQTVLDLEQMPQNAAFDEDLHCLPFILVQILGLYSKDDFGWMQ